MRLCGEKRLYGRQGLLSPDPAGWPARASPGLANSYDRRPFAHVQLLLELRLELRLELHLEPHVRLELQLGRGKCSFNHHHLWPALVGAAAEKN